MSSSLYSSQERERKIRSRLFTSSIILEIRHFHVVVVRSDGEEMDKKSEMHVQSCFFFLNKPIAFMTFSLPSLSRRC